MLTLFLAVLAAYIIASNPFNFLSFERAPYGSGTDKPKKPKEKKPKGGDHRHLMARVKYAGTGATAISGKTGGTVWTLGGVMGSFVRNWAKPKNRRTAGQQLVRGLLSGISSAFRGLTPSQITGWNDLGSGSNAYAFRRDVFGDSRALSGSMAFQKLNNLLRSIDNTLIPFSDAPAESLGDSPILIDNANLDSANFAFDVTTFAGNASLPANFYLRVYATAQVSNGVSFFGKSKFRLVSVFPPTTSLSGVDIFTDYTAKFPVPVTGQKIAVQVEIVETDATNALQGTTFGKSGRVGATFVVS